MNRSEYLNKHIDIIKLSKKFNTPKKLLQVMED
jgi:hypothetical protein